MGGGIDRVAIVEAGIYVQDREEKAAKPKPMNEGMN